MDLAWLDFAGVTREKLTEIAQPVLDPSADEKFPDRLSFWAGRAALQWLLKNRNLSFFVRPDPETDQPRLWDSKGPRSDWWVSLAHTGSIAVAALSPSPIGIDIEPKDRNALRAVQRLLKYEDYEGAKQKLLYRGVSSLEIPVYLWTGLESIGKTSGKGVLLGPPGYQIDWASLKVRDQQATEFIVKFFPRGNFIVSVCTRFDPSQHSPKWCDIRLA